LATLTTRGPRRGTGRHRELATGPPGRATACRLRAGRSPPSHRGEHRVGAGGGL